MSTLPTDTEVDVMALATRLLGQLHHNLTVTSEHAVVCNDCGATWLCNLPDGKLRLFEAVPGNHSCEAEILRAISTPGLYAELGRRRVANRKSVGRQGGRPRKDGMPVRRRAEAKPTANQLEATRQALATFGTLQRKNCLAYEFVALKLGCSKDHAAALVATVHKEGN